MGFVRNDIEAHKLNTYLVEGPKPIVYKPSPLQYAGLQTVSHPDLKSHSESID